jgi:hypothetical protein
MSLASPWLTNTYTLDDKFERHPMCPRNIFREVENTDDLIQIIGVQLFAGNFLKTTL